MLTYPYTLTLDSNRTWFVRFSDIPEALTVGDDQQEAAINAREALEAALEIYFDARRPIPLPSPVLAGQASVTLPALVTSKVFLSNEMIQQGVRKAELARRMGVHMPQVDRLLDVRHASRIDQVESALEKLGRRLEVSLV
ncbi:type II toxin-antitoxin system HicB family antitoxin [Achromobacter sp. HNDS-1]|uniref:Type II toxin-antitoxin system HicB family antitoxin n=1 Tax=Achromobacter sp. HNDS-1 TaxID=3151598 RepID=A0AAU7L8T8_9BURK